MPFRFSTSLTGSLLSQIEIYHDEKNNLYVVTIYVLDRASGDMVTSFFINRDSMGYFTKNKLVLAEIKELIGGDHSIHARLHLTDSKNLTIHYHIQFTYFDPLVLQKFFNMIDITQNNREIRRNYYNKRHSLPLSLLSFSPEPDSTNLLNTSIVSEEDQQRIFNRYSEIYEKKYLGTLNCIFSL